MTWISLVCVLVMASSALGNGGYGAFSGRSLHKPQMHSVFPSVKPINTFADQRIMSQGFTASIPRRIQFLDQPKAPELPLSEADILCKGQRPETVIPRDGGEKFIVCLDDSKGAEQVCPKGLIYSMENRRCERKFAPVTDPCASQPCLNGGQCLRTEYSYQCQCAPGFDGRTCELDARVCQTQRPCGQSPDAICQSFHLGAALQHVCILQDGLVYGLTGQQTFQNPCGNKDGPHPLAFGDKGFIMCDGEQMFIQSCPGGTVWDDSNKVCVWPELRGESSSQSVDQKFQLGFGKIETPRSWDQSLIQKLQTQSGQFGVSQGVREQTIGQRPLTSFGQVQGEKNWEQTMGQRPQTSFGQVQIEKNWEQTVGQRPLTSFGQVQGEKNWEQTVGQRPLTSFGQVQGEKNWEQTVGQRPLTSFGQVQGEKNWEQLLTQKPQINLDQIQGQQNFQQPIFGQVQSQQNWEQTVGQRPQTAFGQMHVPRPEMTQTFGQRQQDVVSSSKSVGY